MSNENEIFDGSRIREWIETWVEREVLEHVVPRLLEQAQKRLEIKFEKIPGKVGVSIQVVLNPERVR